MLSRLRKYVIFAALLLVGTTNLLGQEFQKTSSWDWPIAQSYQELLISYLDQRQADDELRGEVEQHWSQGHTFTGPDLLDHLLSTASMIEPRIASYLSEAQDPSKKPAPPQELEWLTSDVPGWMQDTIRLASGRAYAQRKLYDEGLETLAGLDLNQVCDPSTLIFYRATCEHNLLKQAECLANVDLLLERADELPNRFRQVAKLMKADIADLEEDSLDEVARLMHDVERRLDLGRAGKRVRDEEQEIIDKLEKMIEQAEQQLQEMKDSQSGSEQNQQPNSQSKPMDESQNAGQSGPGDVDKKKKGDRAGWGNLPPAQRKEALQRLTEDLPSHYRDVIEGYFRQLSQDK